MEQEKYIELSRRYLKEGEEHFAKKDFTQASEKYWGCIAELVKAIADKRGWSHHRIHHLSEVIEKLIEETGDVDLGRLYSVAERLHANYYENFATQTSMRAYQEDIRKLVSKLVRILFSIPANTSAQHHP